MPGFFVHAGRRELRSSMTTPLYFLLDKGEKMTIIKTKLFLFSFYPAVTDGNSLQGYVFPWLMIFR